MLYGILFLTLSTAACWVGYSLFMSYIAADPARWPKDISVQTEIKLLLRFLRKEGWQVAEPLPWMNVWVRCHRDKLWLALIVHHKDGLGLPVLLKDCVRDGADHHIVVGIFTRAKVTQDLKDFADQSGIYLVGPSDLRDLPPFIQRAALRKKRLRMPAQAAAIAPAPPDIDLAPSA